MDTKTAVQLAKKGDDSGFNYLYEKTYQSKYYLALKYVKDEELAKDVVQEAYLKAFEKLDMLKDPEKFEAWLGMIVANTAQNVLKKKSPMLFSDITEDTEENFESEIEDADMNTRPETAYTKKETVELVHELIGALSEEQKLCIIMYHIEGHSISEIAETLGCSENTVKSRLVYGRNNIKVRAEELQKRGYQLYTTAPIAIFTYLFTKEEEFLASDGSLEAAKNVMKNIGAEMAKSHSQVAEQAVEKTITEVAVEVGKEAGKAVVKKGFFATAAGKTTAVIVAVGVTGAVATGVIPLENKDNVVIVEDANGVVGETNEQSNAQGRFEQYELVLATFQGMNASYTLHDMDGDGIEELIVSVEDANNSERFNWNIYQYNAQVGTVETIETSYFTGLRTATYINPFGAGLIDISTSPYDGVRTYSELIVVAGALKENRLASYAWDDVSGDAYDENFIELPTWADITDFSLINQYKQKGE